MKKQIRVLTGMHAGARLELTSGILHIGPESDADIQISDWTDAAMVLDYRDDGVITLGAAGAGHTASQLYDLIPRRCNDIVLCIGPSDEIWPTDLDLLQRMLTPPQDVSLPQADYAEARSRASVIRWSIYAVVTAVLGGTAILAVSSQTPSGPPPNSPAGRWLTTDRIVAQLKLPDLHTSHQGDHILVAGIVPTANDAYATTQALGRVPGAAVETQIAAAETIVDDLQSSLGEPGLAVSYLGDGGFRIAGITNITALVQSTAERVRSDYGTAIKRLVFDLKEHGTTMANVSSILTDGSIQYIELADGTKNFATVNQPDPVVPPDASAVPANPTDSEGHVNVPGN